MSSHFLSESLAGECIPESNITNAFVVEKLDSGHEGMGQQLEQGMKISSVSKSIPFQKLTI